MGDLEGRIRGRTRRTRIRCKGCHPKITRTALRACHARRECGIRLPGCWVQKGLTPPTSDAEAEACGRGSAHTGGVVWWLGPPPVSTPRLLQGCLPHRGGLRSGFAAGGARMCHGSGSNSWSLWGVMFVSLHPAIVSKTAGLGCLLHLLRGGCSPPTRKIRAAKARE